MYTLFSNDIPIYLSDDPKELSEKYFVYTDEIGIGSLLAEVRSGNYKQVLLYHSDIKILWKKFKDHFKIEKAAGGLVKNEKQEILFIFRLGKWDLPKGKIENGESKKKAAIREVEEECGISGLEIVEKLPKTYHIFQRNGMESLKITYWYEMKTTYKGNLIPQIEEDITAVVFKNDEEAKMALKNSYESIKLLIQNLER
jgi:8-oxo-dGTP pyrophosphatase MutT (NUDIX family)